MCTYSLSFTFNSSFVCLDNTLFYGHYDIRGSFPLVSTHIRQIITISLMGEGEGGGGRCGSGMSVKRKGKLYDKDSTN